MISGRYLLLLAALTSVIPALQPTNLRAQTANVDARSSPSPRRFPFKRRKKRR
mgnify:CR=1 FL=1